MERSPLGTCARVAAISVFLACVGAPLSAQGTESDSNGDVNCDQAVDLSDAVFILNWLFLGGPDPCPIADADALRAQIEELETALGLKSQEAADCQQDLIASQAEAIAALQDVLACQNSLAATEAALDAKTSDLAACEGNLQEAEAERDAIAADLQVTQGELAAAEIARDLCQETLGQLNPELAACTQELAATQSALTTTQAELATTVQQLSDTQTALTAAEGRIEELESGAALTAALARIAELEVLGCMDPAAANYDCHANVDDGSCEYPGCTDPTAQNYDPDANVDDGSCRYPCTTDCPTIPGFTLLGNNEQLYAEYVHDETGIVFVLLPGGTFMMGSPEDEPDRYLDEGPVHEVTLTPFLIAKYEVRQSEWRAVTGENPSAFVGDERPVERVSWEDCQTFCDMTGLQVPTEAQWEY